MPRFLFLLLWTVVQFGQSDAGELRLTVTDPSGLPIQSAVELVSEANVNIPSSMPHCTAMGRALKATARTPAR